jgi:hypothetical protein
MLALFAQGSGGSLCPVPPVELESQADDSIYSVLREFAIVQAAA